jgi:hypothetical protein
MILIGEYRCRRPVALDVASPDSLLGYQDNAGDLMVLALRVGLLADLDIQKTGAPRYDRQVVFIRLVFRLCRHRLHALAATGQGMPAVIDELHQGVTNWTTVKKKFLCHTYKVL